MDKTDVTDVPYMLIVGFTQSTDDGRVYADKLLADAGSAAPAALYERVEFDIGLTQFSKWVVVYEFLDFDAAGRQQEWLAAYERDSERCNVARNELFGHRLLCRRAVPAEAQPGVSREGYLMLIGTDLPDDITAEDLDEFDRFYTDTHMPEVVSQRHFLRGSRYEVIRPASHSAVEIPRFVGAYEGDEACVRVANQDSAEAVAPVFTPGPPVWSLRRGLWLSMYRRVTSQMGSSQ